MVPPGEKYLSARLWGLENCSVMDELPITYDLKHNQLQEPNLLLWMEHSPTLTVLFCSFLDWILLQEAKSRDGFNVLKKKLRFQILINYSHLAPSYPICSSQLWSTLYPKRWILWVESPHYETCGFLAPGSGSSSRRLEVRKSSRLPCDLPPFSRALCLCFKCNGVIGLGPTSSFHCAFLPWGAHSSLLLVDPGVSVSFITSPNCLTCLPLLYMVWALNSL